MSEPAAGPSSRWSPWERDLWTHLTSHVEEEQGILEEYVAVAEATSSKAFRYLVQLLTEDEIRHHRMLQALASSLEALADFRSDDPPVPYMDFDRAGGEDVRATTRRLLEREQQDAHELDRLQRELRGVKDTTLWALVVDLMRRDTEKHVSILRFVEKHLG